VVRARWWLRWTLRRWRLEYQKERAALMRCAINAGVRMLERAANAD
jgi:hypothetical protein